MSEEQVISKQAGDCPRFRKPPVVETVMGLQFEEIKGLSSLLLGKFHDIIRSEYPKSEEQMRLDRLVETFPRVPRPQGFKLVTQQRRPIRAWFLSEQADRLLQLQADRLTFNWRKPSSDAPYPSYSMNSHCFFEALEKLHRFIADHRLGEISPEIVEVIYVNHIPRMHGQSFAQMFPHYLSGMTLDHSTGFLPEPEVLSWNRVYEIPEKRGRLYAEASVAQNAQDGEDQIIVLKMTARVLHSEDSEIEGTFDIAHEWVVRGFESVTTLSARRDEWEQQP